MSYGRKPHTRRPGSPKAYVPKRKPKKHAYKAPELSAMDKAALANMGPVVVRTVGSYPESVSHAYGHRWCWMSEYSIRACNNNRR